MKQVLLILAALIFLVNSAQGVSAQTPQSGSRINWQGQNWYVHGVNVPWYNWGCDFGCGPNGGVSSTRNTILNGYNSTNPNPEVNGKRMHGFSDLKASNTHVVRWWVFPGDPWQLKDDADNPVSIKSVVYPDFDAALALAEQNDLYYNFVLFSGANAFPDSWREDPATRTKVAQALAPLFLKYKNHPRIISWELFNEPEWQIWRTPGVEEADVKALAREIITVIRQNSPQALISVGSALIEGYGPTEPGITMWKDVDLDYYSPHWYDIHTGNQCLLCFTYNQLKTKYGITKPIIGGEIHAASEVNPLNRYNEFYNKGYAGAWGWSLFRDRTGDLFEVDMAALATFAQSKTDVGPKTTTTTPTPSQSPTSLQHILISPGSNINLVVGKSINLSALAYDSSNRPLFSGVAYQWGISSTNSIGILSPTNREITTLTARNPGNGDVYVVASYQGQQATKSLSVTVTLPTPTPQKPGDVNGDGFINSLDLNEIVINFNRTGIGMPADLNNDGIVNALDFNEVVANYGR